MGEYLDFVAEYLRDNPSQREGQAYYNALRIRWPHLEWDVLGSGRDCFNDDRRLPRFLAWVEGALARERVRRGWVADGAVTNEFWAAVDAVDWRDHDVPGALLALADGEEDAYRRVVGAVADEHSGTVHAVLVPALPFLLAITTRTDERARRAGVEVLLDLLSWVEWEGEPLDGGPHRDDVVRALEGYWGYVRALRFEEARELVAVVEKEGLGLPWKAQPREER